MNIPYMRGRRLLARNVRYLSGSVKTPQESQKSRNYFETRVSMRDSSFLYALASFPRLPAEFDHQFFESVAKHFFLTGYLTQAELDKVSADYPDNHVLLCVQLAVCSVEAVDKQATLQLFKSDFKRLLDRVLSCSCLQYLFFGLVTKMSVNDLSAKNEILDAATKILITERTNVVIRRVASDFLVRMVDVDQLLMDSHMVKQLLEEFCTSDNDNVVEEISSFFLRSRLVANFDETKSRKVYQKLFDSSRPGKNLMNLACEVLFGNQDLILSSIFRSDYSNVTVSCKLAALLLQRHISDDLRAELVRFLGQNAECNVDNLIDCLDEFEKLRPDQVDQVRAHINAAIPHPKRCTDLSILRYLSYLRTSQTSLCMTYVQALLASGIRIQRNPELLSQIVSEAEDLDLMLKNPQIAQMFYSISVEIIKRKNFPNWALVDAAILILDQMTDFLHYDEDAVHTRVVELAVSDEHDVDFVRVSAAKFLLRHDPDRIRGRIGELFLNTNHHDMKIAILDRLILSTLSELPPVEILSQMFAQVVDFESNLDVKEKSLILLHKLELWNQMFTPKLAELTTLVNEQHKRLAENDDITQLLQLVQSVQISTDCYNEHVAKECY